jgi:recombination protein RecA
MSQIKKVYGDGAVFVFGKGIRNNKGVIGTRCLGVDLATGIGGVPRGGVIEIFGPESSGKTTLCLHIIAEEQSLGGTCAFIDAEHALKVKYATKLGVNVNNLIFSQPDYGEQGLDIVEKLVESGEVSLIIVDSVAALVPRSEIEGEMGDATMAVHARLMSQALRKLTAKVEKANVCLIFINQIRNKIGVMFGNPETTTGGNALKFYALMRIDIRRTGSIKVGEKAVANTTRVKIVKSKVSTPFREAKFNIRFGDGIDRFDEIIDYGIDYKILIKSGSWIKYKGKSKIYKKGSREEFRKLLIDNETLSNIIYKKIKKEMIKKEDEDEN